MEHTPSLDICQPHDSYSDVYTSYKTPRLISIQTTTLVRKFSCRFAKKTTGKEERVRATAAEEAVSKEQSSSFSRKLDHTNLPWKYVNPTILPGLLHIPGNFRSQNFAVGSQAIALLMISIRV